MLPRFLHLHPDPIIIVISSLKHRLNRNPVFPLLLLLALTPLLLGGCSLFGDNKKEKPELSEQEYYDQARKELDLNNTQEAIELLQDLESRYPFGAYGQQGQLELIYAQYRNFDYDSAAIAADRFIRLHPGHSNVDYAYYMKGLANYDRDDMGFTRYLSQSQAERDLTNLRQAYVDFSQFLNRFPASPYAADARQRMIFLRNLLAEREIVVARFYFKRKAYLAAANRGRYLVENYPDSPLVGDGLAVMAEGYRLMEIPTLQADTVEVLRLNYPDHPSLRGGNFNYALQFDEPPKVRADRNVASAAEGEKTSDGDSAIMRFLKRLVGNADTRDGASESSSQPPPPVRHPGTPR